MMKTIGLIGGMSWESSLVYYRLINKNVRTRLGGLHSAQCLMYSVDFGEIEPLQHGGRWNEATERLTGATLDRLTHRCHILETKGESYRLREARRRRGGR